MRFTCPSCTKSYRLPPERLGPSGRAQINCPNCKAVVHVKAGEGDVLECRVVGQDSATIAASVRPAVRAAQAAQAEAAAVPAAALRPISEAVAPAPVKAAAAGEAVWYVVIGRDKQGPMPVAEVKALLDALQITGQSLVWQKGLAAWTPLQAAVELQGLVQGQAQPAAAFAAPAAAAAQPSPRPPVARPANGGIAPTAANGQAAQAPAQPAASQASQPAPAQPHPSPAGVAPVAARPMAAAAAAGGSGVAVQPVTRALQPVAAGGAVAAAQRPSQPLPVAAGQRPWQPQPVAAGQRPSQPQPVAQVQQAQGQQAQVQPAASRNTAPRPSPAAKPAAVAPVARSVGSFDDGGGPTMEQDVPFFGASAPASRLQKGAPGPATGKKPAPDLASIGADAHGAAFFGGNHDLDHVDFALPDPNKHKPTKEEYQNLLQEFSVMFRLDKRSKRQKVGIGITIGALILGVITFGVMLQVNASNKRALIDDSRAILAVFALPYQTSVTVAVGGEEDVVDPTAPAGSATVKAEAKRLETSALGGELLKKFRKARPRGIKVSAAGYAGAGGGLSAADEKAFRDRQRINDQMAKDALEARKNPGGKRELVPMGLAATKASAAELRAMCAAREANLRGCSQKLLGGASFKVTMTITEAGKATGVKALAGEDSPEVTDCIGKAFANVSMGLQPSSYSHTCSMD